MSVWISVEERLPEHGSEVLVWAKTGVGDMHAVATLRCDEGWQSDNGWSLQWAMNGVQHVVTHWRALPNPPEEKK